MNEPVKRFSFIAGAGMVLVLLTLGLALLLAQFDRRAMRANKRPGGNRAAENIAAPVIGPVADFALTNQVGEAVSLANLRGQVWVADIIFTRCPGPCRRMTKQMKELQDALPKNSSAKLVSLTTDPDFDSPAILKVYGETNGADWSRWTFLTGTKKQIGGLAIDSLKLAAVEKKPEEREAADDLFVHATIFVVIDKQAQLRGVFETGGEGVDWEKSKQGILALVKQLERAS